MQYLQKRVHLELHFTEVVVQYLSPIHVSGRSLQACFFHWNFSVIFSWDIFVAETFRSFVSQLP